ncbi:MAG: hypothetical protein ACI8VT_003442 [Saprospiraceae bacterium]|jgi:hypothetical protein
MKNLILVLITLCCTSLLLEAQRTETLFGRARSIGAFGGPIVEYQYSGSDVDVLAGGGGALIINNFWIGGYGVASAPSSVFDIPEIQSLEFAHGGFWLGGTFMPDNLIHLYVSTKLGWGAIGIEFDDDDFDYLDDVFVVQPEAGLEVNIFKWFRVAGTASYRLVDGIGVNSGLDSDAFDGFGFNLTFRFGFFGSNWHSRNKDWD